MSTCICGINRCTRNSRNFQPHRRDCRKRNHRCAADIVVAVQNRSEFLFFSRCLCDGDRILTCIKQRVAIHDCQMAFDQIIRGTRIQRFPVPFDGERTRRLRARDGSLREKRKHDARHRQKRQQRCENDPLCLTHNFLLLPRFPGAAIPNFLLAANVSADLSHIFSSAARRKSVFLTHAYPHSARRLQIRRA